MCEIQWNTSDAFQTSSCHCSAESSHRLKWTGFESNFFFLFAIMDNHCLISEQIEDPQIDFSPRGTRVVWRSHKVPKTNTAQRQQQQQQLRPPHDNKPVRRTWWAQRDPINNSRSVGTRGSILPTAAPLYFNCCCCESNSSWDVNISFLSFTLQIFLLPFFYCLIYFQLIISPMWD